MKLVKLPVAEGQYKSTDLIRVIINQSPQKALSVGDMRVRSKMLKKLEAANGEMRLEDAEHEHLKAAAATFPWNVFHQDILDLLEAIESASPVES